METFYVLSKKASAFLCLFFYSSEEEEGSRDRGVPHRWQGYSCTVKPERVFLAQPVLQAAMGISHGVLLTKGTYRSYLLIFSLTQF